MASNVLKEHYKLNLRDFLLKNNFSLSADEVTDISGDHYLALSVHYWNYKESSIMSKLWSFLELSTDCTASALMKIIEDEVLNEYGKNLIAFITDGAPVFSGIYNGVQKLMKSKVPGLIHIHCLAHCTDLVGKKSYYQLEHNIDSFLSMLVYYFTKSSVNKAKFIDLQEKLDFLPSGSLEILMISKTRWLKLFQGIQRINKLWDCLNSFFEGNNFIFFIHKFKFYLFSRKSRKFNRKTNKNRIQFFQ